MSDVVARRDPVEQLAEDFMARLRRGEHPALSEYTAAHPALADEIRDLFPALVMMEEIKPAGTEPHISAAGPGATPEQLGDYRILREVARGGMGVVYEAEQVALGRHVALKVLPTQPGGDALRLLRFRREARSAARLHHTNIVPVFDVGVADGVHYYAMQFIQGQGLDEVLQELRRLRSGEKPTDAPAADLTASLADGLRTGVFAAAPIVPVPRPADPRSEASAILTGTAGHYVRGVARLGVQAADALAHAHGQRVLHRDVKPSNLLLDREGVLWLTDFGLAKDDGDDLTRTGDIVGTLRYMAPERFRGVSDPRTDVYALGVTLYEMLTLRPAFPEQDRVLLIKQVTSDDPPRPRAIDPTLPRDLETIVMKAIEREPGRRYPTAADMADDLRRFLADRPIKARRAAWPEQAWRWCRRNPGVATSLSVAFTFLVLLVVGLSVGTMLVWRAKRDVEAAKGEVEQTLAQEQWALYFQRIALADREHAANNLPRAEELLGLCPEKLRGWEWDYLNRSRGRPPALMRHSRPVIGRGSLSPDGSRFAVGGMDGTIVTWDLATGNPLPEIRAHACPCHVVHTPDGRFVVSADEPTTGDAEVKVWDARTAALLHRWVYPHGSAESIAVSPDGTRLAIAGRRKGVVPVRVDVWELTTGRHTTARDGPHTNAVKGIAFSPDGRLVGSASCDGTVWVADSRTGRTVRLFRHDIRAGHLFWSIAFSPDGRRVAAGYGAEANKENGGVRIWDIETGEEVVTLVGQMTMSLAFGPGGRLAAGGLDGTVRLWDPDRGQQVLTLRGHTNVVTWVGFTPDGCRLISSGGDRVVRVWDATPVRVGENLGDELLTLTGHTNGVTALAVHRSGQFLATASTDGTVRVWNPAAGYALKQVFPLGTESVNAVALAPNGERLAVQWGDGEAAILDARTGKVLRRLELGPDESVNHLAFSPDGRFVAGSENDRTIFVWDAETGKAQRLHDHFNFPYKVAFGVVATRLLLASVSTAGEVRVWDPATGALIERREHDAACAVAFSPDGTRMVTAGWDRVVRVWDTTSWTVVKQFKDPTGGPNAVAFSPDGTLLVWGGVDSTVKVWRLGTDEVVTLRGHRNWVWDVAFTPDGEQIVSASRDASVKVWKNPFLRK